MVPAPVILLVDDDPDILAALGSVLLSEGFRVLQASTGPEAIFLARQHQPDLLLLDLGLPGMNGLDVAQLLNEDPLTASLAIIALTGSWLATHPRHLREAGFSGALRKPFRMAELLFEVRTALSTRGWVER
jgi:CheY-like chemotaxis protein